MIRLSGEKKTRPFLSETKNELISDSLAAMYFIKTDRAANCRTRRPVMVSLAGLVAVFAILTRIKWFHRNFKDGVKKSNSLSEVESW